MEKQLTPRSGKLTRAILLLLTILTIFRPDPGRAEQKADLINQPVTVKFTNETLDQSLEKLKKAASKIAFNYKLNDVSSVRVKAASFVNRPLKAVLDVLMDHTPLEYEEKYNTIVISHKKVAVQTEKTAVTGNVSDKDGPLPCVSVLRWL
jgi:hypothetical protein